MASINERIARARGWSIGATQDGDACVFAENVANVMEINDAECDCYGFMSSDDDWPDYCGIADLWSLLLREIGADAVKLFCDRGSASWCVVYPSLNGVDGKCSVGHADLGTVVCLAWEAWREVANG